MTVNLVNLVKSLSINSLHEGNIAGLYYTCLHKLHSTFLIQAGFDCKSLPVHRFKGISASRSILHILYRGEGRKGSETKAPLYRFNAFFGYFRGCLSQIYHNMNMGKDIKQAGIGYSGSNLLMKYHKAQ